MGLWEQGFGNVQDRMHRAQPSSLIVIQMSSLYTLVSPYPARLEGCGITPQIQMCVQQTAGQHTGDQPQDGLLDGG